jgi:cytochrome oxidase Cu insertion factor (SCO1/SenC/PrrC family)
MNSGLSNTNPTLVAAFRAALVHQGLIALALLAVLALAWLAVREFSPAARQAAQAASWRAEPSARRLLRFGFGALWIFDGLLQAQPAMAAGLPAGVIEPTAAVSPGWVQHIVNWAGTSWSFHPVQAGAAAVWIQVGLGAWLIAAPPGWASRLAGAASAGWGLLVWVFGEAFGGIFAPGLSFLFGAPGAVLFYSAAGLLIALPERRWRGQQLGRQVLAVLGAFAVGMAVLQAWPGRGFWQGAAHGKPGPIAAMAESMSSTPQPHFLSALVSDFGTFDAGHGLAVNLVVVILLAGIGIALVTGERRLVRPALVVLLAVCLADWILIQDLGFLGGLGTDPNSMLPLALLAVGGYVALVRVPATDPATNPGAEPAAATLGPASGLATRGQRAAARLAHAFGSSSLRAIVAVWGAAVVVIGAGPMALAQANKTADPIIAQAIDGNAAPLNFAAPGFALTDQAGRPVSLASLHGKVVLLTFLDPVCTSDCPLIAQEFRAADRLLSRQSRQVELVAIVANPVDYSVAYTRAFDSQEGLARLPNWLFLTGSPAQLRQVWSNYGVAAEVLPAGGMIEHGDLAYVIDAAGHTRFELNFDPGPGTASSESSFAAELSSAAQQVLRSR